MLAKPDGGPWDAGSAPAPAPAGERASVEPSTQGSPLAQATRVVGGLRIATVFADGSVAPHVGFQYALLARGAPVRAAKTDAAGEALLEGLEPGQYALYGDRGGFDTAQVLQGHVASPPADGRAMEELLELLTVRHVLTLPEGHDVRGRVVDASGRGIAGAQIWISTGLTRSTGTVVATSDAEGSFSARQLGTECFVGARAAGFAPSKPLHVEHEVERARLEGRATEGGLQCLLELPGPGARVAGVVVDPSGRPVPGARVRVGAQGFFDNLGPTGAEGPPPPVEVLTGAGGGFEAAGLAPGRIQVACQAYGFPVAAAALDVEPHGQGRIELRLEPAAWVRGRATDGEGRPLRGVRVQALERRFLHPLPGSSFDELHCETGAEGRFELGPLGAGEVHLSARSGDGGGTAQTTLHARAGAVHGWDFTLAAAPAITGWALDADGTPLEGWSVSARSMEALGPPPRAAITSGGGAFALRFTGTGPMRLELHAPQEGTRWVPAAPLAWLEGVEVGATDVRLVVDPRARPAAVLRGSWSSAATPPPAAVIARVFHPGFGAVAEAEVAHGAAFELAQLPAGVLELRIEAPGHAPLVKGGIAVGPGESVELGVLELPVAAGLVLRILDAGSAPRPAPHVELLDAQGRSHDGALAGDRWISQLLPEGAYTLLVRAGGRADLRAELALRAGETLERELTLFPGATLGLVFVGEAGAPLTVPVRVRILDRAGALVHSERLSAPAGAAPSCFLAAPLGPLRIEAESDDGRRATWDLDFRGQLPGDRAQPLVLR